MKSCSAYRRTLRAVLSILALTLMAGLLHPPGAQAYDQYSGGAQGGCIDCHGDFRDANYTSLVDGQSWGNLHNLHRMGMLGGDCDTCHTGTAATRFPVFTSSSNGGAGLPPDGCAGCHGRQEDAFDPMGSAVGSAAGLRQHHYTASPPVTICENCHADANPANFTPSGEDVLPAYYFLPDAAHPDKPTDPCNPAGEEQFAGLAIGLDNDGDTLFDGNDDDCVDSDGDGISDAADPCLTFFNMTPLPLPGDPGDENGDGIPNECQCGETDGNGFLTATDAFAIVACGANPGCAQGPPVLDLWDTDLSGFLTATDAFNDVSRGASGTEYLNVCVRRPEGTPAP